MDNRIAEVALAMMEKNRGDVKRIEHSIKVFTYARLLGEVELLDKKQLEILGLTALLHDIGIHVAEKKYGSSSGKYQEIEGPAVAYEILSALNTEPEIMERVCFIISKHHTITAIDGIDFQLLVEADFLVNSTEDHLSDQQIIRYARSVFKSETGFCYLKNLFPHLDFREGVIGMEDIDVFD